MAIGANIIVSSNPRGYFREGIIQDTSAPGTIMQLQYNQSPAAGNMFNWLAGNLFNDGLKMLPVILLEDREQGFLATTAYVSGTKCFLYGAIPFDELNLLAGEAGGTTNYYHVGDRFFIDAENGLLVPETGTSTFDDCVAVCLENFSTVGQVNSFLVDFFWAGA